MSRYGHWARQALAPVEVVAGARSLETESVLLKDLYHLSPAHEDEGGGELDADVTVILRPLMAH